MATVIEKTTADPMIAAAPIATWFGIGGGADRFCVPRSVGELKRCLDIDPTLRVLGEGANLLVDDDGVSELVVELSSPAFTKVEIDTKTGAATVGAGADLSKLVVESVRLEGLGGIPAMIGGAVIMNAGGAFGQICDSVVRVHGLDRAGHEVVLERSQIDFSYRHSGLTGLIITSVELLLPPGNPAMLRARLKDVMAYKKNSQPMAENSAGCCFKNPTVDAAFAERMGASVVQQVGSESRPTQRVSAGLLIDRAGCKGMRVGGAMVSPRHGNFVVTGPGAKARDVIELMELMVKRVRDAFGVTIEPEVVIWRRGK
jgi:UDP-N-acetylmuramate dehydrogenase